MSLPEPPSKIGTGAPTAVRRQEKLGASCTPPLPLDILGQCQRHWKAPNWGLAGRRAGKKKERKGGIDLSLQSWCQHQSGG